MYEDICCKFRVPLDLLSDQESRFRCDLLQCLCEKMKITRRYTTPYYPQCNGLNERVNGELVQILTKVTSHHGKSWDLEVPSALWSYQTSVKTSTRFTPFRLFFGKEALFLVEVEITALKMLEKVVGHSEDALIERLLQLTGGPT